jgi:hypothetical protein
LGSSPITDPHLRWEAHQKSRPFLTRALPGLSGTMTLLHGGLPPFATVRARPRLRASPTLPACFAHLLERDRDSRRLLPYLTRPSPFLSRVGIRDFTFEAYLGFNLMLRPSDCSTAQGCLVARFSPARYPPSRLPLPDPPTTIWLSFPGNPRCGALRNRSRRFRPEIRREALLPDLQGILGKKRRRSYI